MVQVIPNLNHVFEASKKLLETSIGMNLLTTVDQKVQVRKNFFNTLRQKIALYAHTSNICTSEGAGSFFNDRTF